MRRLTLMNKEHRPLSHPVNSGIRLYRLSHRRAKPSRPCGRKMIIAMKMNAERDQIRKLVAEEARHQFAQQLEEAGADDRADQRADAAHDVEDHGVARGHEIDEIRRGEFVLDRIEHAGKPCEQSRQHHRHDLVALDRIADGARARLVLADRLQHHAERRLRDAPQDQIGRRHHRQHEPVQRRGREAHVDR